MKLTHPPDRSPRSDGDTQPSRQQQPEPRLPHERDESADAQGPAAVDVKQRDTKAFDDLMQGRVDTDKAPVMDAVYAQQRKPAVRPVRSGRK